VEGALASGASRDHNFLVIEKSDDAAHSGRWDVRCDRLIRDHSHFQKEVAHVDVVENCLQGGPLRPSATCQRLVSHEQYIDCRVFHKVEKDRIHHIVHTRENRTELLSH